jgi:hypothetical protein
MMHRLTRHALPVTLALILGSMLTLPGVWAQPSGPFVFPQPVIFNGGTSSGIGTSSITVNGPASLAGTTMIPSTATLTVNGTVNGTNAPITPSSTGVTLTGSNTYAGTTTFTGDTFFGSSRPWVDLRAKGAKCDGTTNDSSAFAAAVAALPAAGGILYIPPGTCLLTGGGTITASTVAVIMSPGATLVLGAPLIFGSTTAATNSQRAVLYVQAASGYAGDLVRFYNTEDGHYEVYMTANCTACTLARVLSTNGHGNADNYYTIQQAGGGPANGIILENGSAADGIASLSTDFINGNVFWKPDFALQSATGYAVNLIGTGTVTGSATGTINRNVFWRPDISAFGTSGNCFHVQSVRAAYTELYEPTCESGGYAGVTYSVDTTTAGGTGGQSWRIYHPVMVGTYAAQHLGTTDTWWGDETNPTTLGTLSALANAVTIGGSSAGSTSTSFVSSGLGAAFTPNYLTTSVITCSVQANNNTINDGLRVALYRNTTGIPANGTSVGTDTQLYLWGANTSLGAGGVNFMYSVTYRDSGLVPGTTYYYYLANEAITGGTAALGPVACLISEQ